MNPVPEIIKIKYNEDAPIYIRSTHPTAWEPGHPK
jgi:hypothetical protein